MDFGSNLCFGVRRRQQESETQRFHELRKEHEASMQTFRERSAEVEAAELDAQSYPLPMHLFSRIQEGICRHSGDWGFRRLAMLLEKLQENIEKLDLIQGGLPLGNNARQYFRCGVSRSHSGD